MKRIYEIGMLSISYYSYGLGNNYYNYANNADLFLLLIMTLIGACIYRSYVK